MGAAGLRGDAGARRGRRAHVARPPGPDGRREHVPQPGSHGQDHDHARPRLRRTGRPRHRRCVVRVASTRRSDWTSGRGSGSVLTASTRRLGSSGACSTASASATPDASTPSPTRRSRRSRSRRICRSWWAGPARRRRSARWPACADAWNTAGTVEEVAARDAILRAHCADVGRDPSTIERTVSFPIVLRDDPADAARAFAALCAHNGTPDAGNVPTLLGSPAQVADADPPVRGAGLHHGHRATSRPVRRGDARPDRRGPRRPGRLSGTP